MACAIEDAGFEIRDQLQWLYGSGFPKSHDVSKGIDRAAGAERELTRAGSVRRNGYGDDWDTGPSTDRPRYDNPATDSAIQWQGWGTALKPAAEPICFARKPLVGTVAQNVLAHGTGAINVDGCRVGYESDADMRLETRGVHTSTKSYDGLSEDGGAFGGLPAGRTIAAPNKAGRWPANIIHDGSDEVVGMFPDSEAGGNTGPGHPSSKTNNVYGNFKDRSNHGSFHDIGSAARFFYTAKADANDRIGSKHPTVKPVDLMQWLVRLVTPKGGVCLDPFAGTGTTAEACYREGMRCMLVERETEYQGDIRRRMALVMAGPDERARESIKEKLKNQPIDHGPLFRGKGDDADR
jgi:site-specific DNA-methyltransferase (adenine-specific)